MPASWREAAIDNLRTEGAFLVSAVRKASRTRFVRVTSLAGEPCRLQTDLADPVHLVGKGEGALRRTSANLLELNLFKGESVILYSGDTAPDLLIRPVSTQTGQPNAYGLKNPAKSTH